MKFPNPTAQADDLAALIVKLVGGRVETLKLQKLMYYSNGWSLALHGRPLFSDKIEAWKHGPVIPSIYKKHRTKPSVEEWDVGDPTNISLEDRIIVESVVDVYGMKSGWALRQMTHDEAPWVDAWERCNFGERRNEVITQQEIRDFFVSQSITKNAL